MGLQDDMVAHNFVGQEFRTGLAGGCLSGVSDEAGVSDVVGVFDVSWGCGHLTAPLFWMSRCRPHALGQQFVLSVAGHSAGLLIRVPTRGLSNLVSE